jgi:hypothetical protein
VGGAVGAGCGALSLAGLLVGVGLTVWLGSVVMGDIGGSRSASRGTRSEELAVAVAPAEKLDDGSPVFVTSSAFRPNELVGVAVCLAADIDRGIDACDTVSSTRYFTDSDGRLAVRFAVPRVITVGKDAYDCADVPERCLVVAAAEEDRNRSGGVAVSFREALPRVVLTPETKRPQTDRLPVTAAPSGPLAPKTRVTVTARGFQPGEPVVVGRCSNRFASKGITACEPVGSSGDVVVLLTHEPDADTRRADENGNVVVEITLAAEVSEISSGSDTPVDCAERPGRCTIVVAAAADTRRSAVLPYTLTPD